MECEMTLCDYCGVESSVAALKGRWFNLNTDRLRTAALLAGCPGDWVATILEHFKTFLSQVEGDSFDLWSDNAEDLFLELIQGTACELAGSELSTGALAASGLENQSAAYNDAVKGSNIPAISDSFDLAAAAKKNPLIEKLYPYINKYRKDTIDSMFNDFQKDPAIAKDQTLLTASAMLQQAIGVTPAGLASMTQQRVIAAAENKTPSYAEAIAIKNDPNASAALKTKAAGIIKDTDANTIARENRINQAKAD